MDHQHACGAPGPTVNVPASKIGKAPRKVQTSCNRPSGHKAGMHEWVGWAGVRVRWTEDPDDAEIRYLYQSRSNNGH